MVVVGRWWGGGGEVVGRWWGDGSWEMEEEVRWVSRAQVVCVAEQGLWTEECLGPRWH